MYIGSYSVVSITDSQLICLYRPLVKWWVSCTPAVLCHALQGYATAWQWQYLLVKQRMASTW
jgi:hypothetical protein